MPTAEQIRNLLAAHGSVRSQAPSDWHGLFPLPPAVEQFYCEVGPVDIYIEQCGNRFFLPSLAGLWQYQAGYRWSGRTGEPIPEWLDDWLAVGDEGEGVFIFSRASGEVLHDLHGRGTWEPTKLFPNLNTMAACLGQLGAIVASAGKNLTDEKYCLRPEWQDKMLTALRDLLGSSSAAESVLRALGHI